MWPLFSKPAKQNKKQHPFWFQTSQRSLKTLQLGGRAGKKVGREQMGAFFFPPQNPVCGSGHSTSHGQTEVGVTPPLLLKGQQAHPTMLRRGIVHSQRKAEVAAPFVQACQLQWLQCGLVFCRNTEVPRSWLHFRQVMPSSCRRWILALCGHAVLVRSCRVFLFAMRAFGGFRAEVFSGWGNHRQKPPFGGVPIFCYVQICLRMFAGTGTCWAFPCKTGISASRKVVLR